MCERILHVWQCWIKLFHDFQKWKYHLMSIWKFNLNPIEITLCWVQTEMFIEREWQSNVTPFFGNTLYSIDSPRRVISMSHSEAQYGTSGTRIMCIVLMKCRVMLKIFIIILSCWVFRLSIFNKTKFPFFPNHFIGKQNKFVYEMIKYVTLYYIVYHDWNIKII